MQINLWFQLIIVKPCTCMVATASDFWNFLTFPWLFPDKCKIFLTNWIKSFTNWSWKWTQRSPHSHPHRPFIHAFREIHMRHAKRINFLENPTSAYCSISWTKYYQYNTIHVCKMYKCTLEISLFLSSLKGLNFPWLKVKLPDLTFQSLSGQMIILARHCPLTGRYFERCNCIPAKLRRSKIWRLSILHYTPHPHPPPPECQQHQHPQPSTPPPPAPTNCLRTLYDVLHEVHGIKMRFHYCDDELIFVID